VIGVLFKNLLSVLKGLLELFVFIESKHLIKEVLLFLLEAVSG
jgi:hypothetical protein